MDLTFAVAGIPAAACITDVGKEGLEYILLDERGREAPWLEEKLDRHELDAIVIEAYEAACDRILEIL